MYCFTTDTLKKNFKQKKASLLIGWGLFLSKKFHSVSLAVLVNA